MHAIATYTSILAISATTHAYVAPIKSSKTYNTYNEGGEERPEYQVLQKFDGYELRRYSPSVWTTAIGSANGWSYNSPFQQLFQYISGANEKRMKIAMTAPVLSVMNSRQQRQWFYMPKKHHNDAPEPTAFGVENVRWGPLEVYVLSYSPPNNMNNWYKMEAQKKLIAAMMRDGFKLPKNEIVMHAAYNDPWAKVFESEVWITKDQVME